MTQVATKTPVEAVWNVKKVNEITSKIWANNYLSTMAVLSKYGPEAVKEFNKEVLTHKVEYLKSVGVKTPIDLAKAKAEVDANVFGSKIEIVGDEKKAQIIYKQCNCWNALKNEGKLSVKDQEQQGKCFSEMVSGLAQAFGFKGEVVFEGETAIITFTK
jgi:hypothetical protein